MATTPNYGWVTPAPTDFVTDLPADFETFADAVDDTVKDLNPGTTAGDIDYYTSSTAKARLGIGTAGQVLAVNSGATAPEWVTSISGGMTLIATGSLNTGAGAVTTLTSIPQTYNNLLLTLTDYTASGAWTMLRINGDSGTNYYGSGIYSNNKTDGSNANTATMMILDRIRNYGSGYAASASGNAQFIIYNYATSQKMHGITATGSAFISATNGSAGLQQWGHYKSAAAAITEINIYPESTSTYTHSGTYILWGLS